MNGQIKIGKSPVAPVCTFLCSVKAQGIVQEDGTVVMEQDNYWHSTITPRSTMPAGACDLLSYSSHSCVGSIQQHHGPAHSSFLKAGLEQVA